MQALGLELSQYIDAKALLCPVSSTLSRSWLIVELETYQFKLQYVSPGRSILRPAGIKRNCKTEKLWVFTWMWGANQKVLSTTLAR